ncbi:hypothetical protein PTTG_28195 [Puccinia triticina 1-1 BBBD Race 1]|uniref:Alpha-1,3-mannosyltransferase CMT1 n=2 Tax=Puccinia triticina TaxID=208348 RepID=A0A180GDF1_PUCT1|nr:hypothetical protein PTTG_28195 [Puccinia triticina 1-1 BBBD Race 1]WAR63319.1 hypothetical protein PtB15_18B402 [Puccinia triticina]
MAHAGAEKPLLSPPQPPARPPPRRPPSTSSSAYARHPQPSTALACWPNRRITKALLLYPAVLLGLAFLYLRYLHRLIFIDYAAFPPRTGPVIVHPGVDPELSVPAYNLTEHILRTSRPSGAPILDHNLRIDRAIDELTRRFQSVWISPSSLSCRPSPETEALLRTRFLDAAGRPQGRHKLMIALNLHSSQEVLPALTEGILTALRYLGPSKVYVSVYENGSWDHTPEGLGHLGAVLTGLGVGHRIRCAREETIWTGVDRIKLLAAYRNEALSGFAQADRILAGLSDLVFINDVFLCAQDILELVWQRRVQGADAACGTDWREAKTLLDQYGWPATPVRDPSPSEPAADKTVVFYDSWVTRSLSGKTLRPRLDLLTEYKDGYAAIFAAEESQLFQARFRNALPVPVYSCWNGIVALAPTPFRAPQGLRFRAADRRADECPSSECQLLAKDFWSLGFPKWILVPKVAVTYTRTIYHAPALVRGSNRDNRPASRRPPHLSPVSLADAQASAEEIDWSRYSKPDTVVCWPDMYKFHIDFEWNHVLESPYNPKLLAGPHHPDHPGYSKHFSNSAPT